MTGLKTIGCAVAAGLLSATLASSAWAQAQQPQNNAGNNAANAAGNATGNAAANAQNNMNYNGINQSPWFSHQGVRDQLQLNENQYNQLNQNYGRSWTRYNQGISGLGNDLSEQQRQQRQQELYGSFHKDFSNGTTEVFTDPASRQRYNQLHLQFQGYGAFNDPTVQQQLNLTPAQRQKFNQANRDWNRQMNTWHRDYSSNPDAVLSKFNGSRQEYQENLKTMLTPEQQKNWSEMTGKPYDFTPDVYFQNGPVTVSKPVLK